MIRKDLEKGTDQAITEEIEALRQYLEAPVSNKRERLSKEALLEKLLPKASTRALSKYFLGNTE